MVYKIPSLLHKRGPFPLKVVPQCDPGGIIPDWMYDVAKLKRDTTINGIKLGGCWDLGGAAD